jgi:PPOX class probable F420-dependent enzyme
VTPDGRPHVVPVCFVLDGDAIYSAVDGKPKSSLALARLDNIRCHPTVSLLVDAYDEDWTRLWWIRVDARATVLTEGPRREHALDLLVEKYEQYRALRPPGAVIAMTTSAWHAWPH